MEIALAALLAAAAFVATWAFTARNNERARAYRLAEELEALRRPSHLPSADKGSGAISPGQDIAPDELSTDSTAEPETRRGDRALMSEARLAISQAYSALKDEQRSRSHPEGIAPAHLAADSLEALKQDARAFLVAAESVESSLSELLMRTAPFQLTPVSVDPHPPAIEQEAAPGRTEEELISDASAAIEELSDPTSRMADDLGSVLRNADRIRTSAIQSGAALATVSRSADSLTPLASALSSLSNRINLLALNLAVLVNPGARDSGEFDKAGDELRGLFEETRRLSREVGSLSQRAAVAARSAGESSEDLVAAATDGHARAEHGLQELAHLEELTIHLKEDLEETRRASRGQHERRIRLELELSTAGAAEAALAAHLRDLHRHAERWVSDLHELATTLHDTRTSGERTVRALLKSCEQPGPASARDAEVGSRCAELLMHATELLDRLTPAGAPEQTSREV